MITTTLPQATSPGNAPQVFVYKRGKKGKKGSRKLRRLERAVGQMADAGSRFSVEYRARHHRSNRKKKDGWLRDLHENLFDSIRKARKRIKLDKIFKL